MDNNPKDNPQESLSNPQPGPQPNAPDANPVPQDTVPPTPQVVTGDSSGPEPPTNQPNPVTPGYVPVNPSGGSKKRLPKAAAITLLVIILAGFASAAAYFGAVVPNKPENVLKKALLNTVQEKQVSFKGNITSDQTGKDSDGQLSLKIGMDGKADLQKKASEANTSITVSGINLALAAKYIDNTAYVKASNLSTISSLVAAYSPEAGGIVKSASGIIDGKWIEIDSTLLKEAGGSCVMDSNWALTDQDVDLLTSQYSKNAFATIKSSSSDNVGSEAATKFEIDIDNKKIEKYSNNLNDLSLIKSLSKCPDSEELTKASSGATGTTHLTLWVDKATKHVKQLTYASTSEDKAKYGTSGKATVTFDYKPVSITKPSDATPVMDILAQLQTALSSSGIDLTNLIPADTAVQ